MHEPRSPIGIILLAIFFGAGALICLVTTLALAFPGSFFEAIWQWRPEARIEFQKLGNCSMLLMGTLGFACAFAALGLACQAEWGRRLAIGILTANLIGDSLNALLRHDLRTLVGLPIGGLMIWYLVTVRRAGNQSANAQNPSS
ncbi:MAG TPA: hypothetical protein VLO30_03490 [Chthoniobacterales bacterium]|nr:hypothetical protein [Chthoniobacterales bacterium]